MGRRARLLVIGLLGATAPWLPAPARAATRDRVAPLTATGGVLVEWQGAGVEGSARFLPGEGRVTLDRRTGGLTSASLPALIPATAKVTRPAPDGPTLLCQDTPRPPFAGFAGFADFADLLDAEELRSRRARIGVGSFLHETLSAGRCAGPRPRDLVALMPRPRRTSGAIGRRAVTVDLRRPRRTARVGAFAVQISSSLRLRVGPVRRGRTVARPADLEEDTGSDAGPQGRVALLELGYVVRRVSGSLTAEYRGGEAPGCEPLDACGLTGSRSLSLDGFPNAETEDVASLDLTATRPLRGRRPSLARLVKDLRAGRLDGNADLTVEGDAAGTARVARPGAVPCDDAGPVELPPLETRLDRTGLRIELGPPGFILNEDPLRSRCAGPDFGDALGKEPLATAVVSAAALGDRTLRLTLRAGGAFPPAGAFTGERRGELVLDLERTRLRASALRLR